MDGLHGLLDAVDRRIGHRRLLDLALKEEIPGGASWAYVFGSSALILFFIQLATGLLLATYYSPSATDAWASVAYLERAIPFGAFVRGMHHHAASAMVIIVGLHLLQVVLFGAYKAPREANWLSGLGLLGLVLAFALTGYLLPWDQTGYWATKVATSIAGTLPVVGDLVQRIAQGGNDYGHLTLTRFYALHVILLPLLTLVLIGAHLALFRRHGVTPSPAKSPEALSKIEQLWPTQLAYDAMFATVVVAAISMLSLTLGAPLEAPADPASNFIARPEWYFLFLFQLLKYFEGPLQIVGTVILPGLATTFLLLLPFLDSGPSRRLRDRKPWIAAMGLGLVGMAGLTALAVRSDNRDPMIAAQRVIAATEAARAKELAALGVPVEGPTHMLSADPLTRGARVFRQECATCHPLGDEVPEEIKGPELTGYGSRAWIRQVLRDPDSPRLFGKTKVSGMDAYAHLSSTDLEALVELVYSRRVPDAPPVEDTKAAALVEEHECGNCHDFEEAFGLDGPSLFGYLSESWVRSVVDQADAQHLYDQANDMPIFSTRLSERDRAAVVVFVLAQEALTPKDRWPSVDDPGPVPSPRIEPAKTSTPSGL
jgi:ubiquinol-cytochrome c reductase cytochrome b subunit